MSVVFLDNIESYNNSDEFLTLWDGVGFSSIGTLINTTQQRHGARCLYVPTFGGWISKSLPSFPGYIFGAALKPDAHPTSGNSAMFSFSLGGTVHMRVMQDTAGKPYLVNGAGTTVATTTHALTVGTYVYFEVKLVVAGSGGLMEVRVNGATWLSFSGNTRNGGDSNLNTLIIGDSGQTGSWAGYFDDIYILDTNGSRNTDFQGDSTVLTLRPTGAGALTQWTVAGSGTNWGAVDDPTPDENATYIESDVPTATDVYAHDSVASDLTIAAVEVVWRGKRLDDLVDAGVHGVVRAGGVNYPSGVVALNSGFRYYGAFWDGDPSTAGSWTPAAINAAQFGVERNNA